VQRLLGLLGLFAFCTGCSVGIQQSVTQQSRPAFSAPAQQSRVAFRRTADLSPRTPGSHPVGASGQTVAVWFSDPASGALEPIDVSPTSAGRIEVLNASELSLLVRTGREAQSVSLDTGFSTIALQRVHADQWVATFQYLNTANSPSASSDLRLTINSDNTAQHVVIPIDVIHDP